VSRRQIWRRSGRSISDNDLGERSEFAFPHSSLAPGSRFPNAKPFLVPDHLSPATVTEDEMTGVMPASEVHPDVAAPRTRWRAGRVRVQAWGWMALRLSVHPERASEKLRRW
jgi:hypothetical protein